MKQFKQTLMTASCALVAAGFVWAEDVSIGSYQGAVGQTVNVQVVLQPVNNVASAQLQINYDPNLVSVVSVTNVGAVGGRFLMGYKDHNGSLDVVMACDSGSCSQAGTLLDIDFRIKDGALVGMSSDLIIARKDLGGDYGAKLAVQEDSSQSNGKLLVAPAASVDSDGDGVPDWWSWQHFQVYTNIDLLADDDHDGLKNKDEYSAGTDPKDSGSVLKMTMPDFTNLTSGLVLRWSSVTGKSYRLDRATNLLDGFNTPFRTNIEATPPENSYLDTSATNAGPYFYRIGVE